MESDSDASLFGLAITLFYSAVHGDVKFVRSDRNHP